MNTNKPIDFSAFPDNRLSGDTPLRQAQLVMLRLLRIFDAICKKHSLDYWLDAGTLLGAARHDGFIPWDDDVDVVMPQKDYEKFLLIAAQELPYDVFFQTKETDPQHDISWAKFRDRFSYMDDPGGPYPYSQGIPIDIFPMYIQTKRQFKLRNFFSLLPPFNNPPLKPAKRFSRKHNLYNIVWGTIQHISTVLFKLPFLSKALIKWSNNSPTGWAYNPERPWFQFFPENIVYPLSQINFEGYSFSAPGNIEQYLTIYYGNWKQLPPENKRNVHNVNKIHVTDAGPVPHHTSLKWK